MADWSDWYTKLWLHPNWAQLPTSVARCVVCFYILPLGALSTIIMHWMNENDASSLRERESRTQCTNKSPLRLVPQLEPQIRETNWPHKDTPVCVCVWTRSTKPNTWKQVRGPKTYGDSVRWSAKVKWWLQSIS